MPPAFGSQPLARILLVDGDEPTRRLVQRALNQGGDTVITAREARAALRAAGRAMDDPRTALHLALINFQLPGMDGRELGRILTARWQVLPVIYMAGPTKGSGARAGLPEGEPVLEKPFLAEELLRRISAALGRSASAHAAPSAPRRISAPLETLLPDPGPQPPGHPANARPANARPANRLNDRAFELLERIQRREDLFPTGPGSSTDLEEDADRMFLVLALRSSGLVKFDDDAVSRRVDGSNRTVSRCRVTPAGCEALEDVWQPRRRAARP